MIVFVTQMLKICTNINFLLPSTFISGSIIQKLVTNLNGELIDETFCLKELRYSYSHILAGLLISFIENGVSLFVDFYQTLLFLLVNQCLILFLQTKHMSETMHTLNFVCLLAISTTSQDSQPPRLKQKVLDKSHIFHLLFFWTNTPHPSLLSYVLASISRDHTVYYLLFRHEWTEKKTSSPNFILPNTSNLQIQNLLNNYFHWQVSRKVPLCLPIQKEKQNLWKVGRVYILSLAITILFQALQRCRCHCCY